MLETRAEVKTALASCWKPHWDATHASEMKVTIAYRYGFDLDALEDLDHTWIRAAEAEPPADPAEAEATRCVRQRSIRWPPARDARWARRRAGTPPSRSRVRLRPIVASRTGGL
jgi:hypothetical protein